MHAPEKYMERFAHLPWDRQVMAAMISAVDDGVGAIHAELERLGLADNTLSVFTSDNGPSRESRNWLDGTLDPYYGGTAGHFRGHKFSLFEGGIREPGIMHWPAGIPAGQIVDHPCASMDVFPTLLALAGGNPADYELDGTSLLPLVTQAAPLPERDILWELGDQTAIRRGPWKLVLNPRQVEHEGPVAPVWLSNLDNDPGERTNLVDAQPALAADLRQAAETWRHGIDRRWEEEWQPAIDAIAAHHP